MKTHLNLATADLEKSVLFYSTLLKQGPVKLLSDYALFITEEPGLELALDLRDAVIVGSDAHYGVCVESSEGVDEAIARLQKAGLVASVEREATCCYANQTKVWAIDPDGRRWEIYTALEETEDRDDVEAACCNSDSAGRPGCAA